jgi:hypothetical protein
MQLVKFLRLDMQAVLDLTTTRCAAFNEEVRDVDGVRYFSVSAARPWSRVPPFAMHANRIVQAAEGDNDSLVSVKSSTWGEHLGVWQADHWRTINRRYTIQLKDPTGDIVPRWMQMLDHVVEQLQRCHPERRRYSAEVEGSSHDRQ